MRHVVTLNLNEHRLRTLGKHTIALHTPACACGWQAHAPIPYADDARALHDAHAWQALHDAAARCPRPAHRRWPRWTLAVYWCGRWHLIPRPR